MRRISLQTAERGLGLSRALYKRGLYRSFAQAQVRFNATTNTGAEQRRRPLLRTTLAVAKWTGLLIGSAGIGLVLIGAGVFIHDAFTYSDKHLDRVPVNPLALNPKLGGPKSLPIAEVNLDDEENEGEHRAWVHARDACAFDHIAGGYISHVKCFLLIRRFRVCQPRNKTQAGHCRWWMGSESLASLALGLLTSSPTKAIGILQTLNPGEYHVTVVAPGEAELRIPYTCVLRSHSRNL